MRRIGEFLVRALPLMLCVALTALALYVIGPLELQAVGEGAAMLMMGLSHSETAQQTALAEVPAETAPTLPTSVAASASSISSVIPPKGNGGGAVSEEQLSGGPAVAGMVTVKNVSGMAHDFAALLAAGAPMATPDASLPQVLIVHTHASECYMPYYAGYYNADDPSRTTDTSANVVAVGEVIAQELRAAGVPTLHDATLHDHPAYTGAYDRSAATVQAYLAKYPSIQVVLDIHRDAMLREDLTKVKPTVTVQGQKAAQMMIIAGGVNSEEYPNPHVEHNLRLALQLHETLEQTASGIMRPLYVVNETYNQELTAGSLLVEMGTDANTLTEALYSGRLLGKALARVIEGQ